jgi:hypothetical protein
MKQILFAITAASILAGCQTTTMPVEAKAKHSTIKVASNPQYERYKSFIKTPMRDLKVDPDFSLIKDKKYFMNYIRYRVPQKLTYPGPRSYRRNYDGDKCHQDLKSLTTVNAMRNYQKHQISWSMGVCLEIIANDFAKNPNNNTYKKVLLDWVETDRLKNANRLRSKEAGLQSDMTFVVRMAVGHLMGHYAVYHPFYKLTDEQHAAVDDMFTEYVHTYRYYNKFQSQGPFFAHLCDLKNPKSWSKNNKGPTDHCGTVNGHIAVGATYYGAEFGNQLVFDYGVQATEIFLAMLSKDKVYATQIGRGMAGMGYADELPPMVDQLDLLFETAFGFDFDEYRNVHGVTPGEVYKHQYHVGNNIELMMPYYSVERDNGDSYPGEFKDMVRDGKDQAVWGAYSIQRYLTTAPMLAKKYHGDMYKKFRVNDTSYQFGMRIVGFSPRSVREALKK